MDCGNCIGCRYSVGCDYDYTFQDALRELSLHRATEQRYLDALAARKKEKERKYQEHIASLDKLPGAIRLFRTWKLYPDGSLKAMTQDHIWQPGENVTLASGANAGSDSGFYGFSTLDELKKQEKDWWEKSQSGEESRTYEHGYGRGFYYVCGTMLCYGHVKLSDKGGRVQKAIPEYIIEPDGSDPDFGMLVVNAADKYGMRIVTVEQAEELQTGLVQYWKGRPI